MAKDVCNLRSSPRGDTRITEQVFGTVSPAFSQSISTAWLVADSRQIFKALIQIHVLPANRPKQIIFLYRAARLL